MSEAEAGIELLLMTPAADPRPAGTPDAAAAAAAAAFDLLADCSAAAVRDDNSINC